jgi:hypothetical protein
MEQRVLESLGPHAIAGRRRKLLADADVRQPEGASARRGGISKYRAIG